MATRRAKAMGPSKGKQRVLKSILILVGSVAVAWVTWERSCILAIWLAIEGLFWVFQTFRYHKLNSMAQNPPNDDVQVRIDQFATLAGVLEMREFLSGWFMNVPFDLLTREQVLDFIAYGFWYEDRSEMSLEQQEQVKDALIRLEAVFDFHVPDVAEGPSNKDLRFMCHLWEPLRATPVLVDTAPHDNESPISEAIRRHSFSGSAVHRPSRTGDHWRRHQAALSSAGSRRESVDGSMGGGKPEHTQEMGSLSGEEHSKTGTMAWNIWRTQNGKHSNSIMSAIAGISLPSAHEMNLLFGAKVPEQIPEGKPRVSTTYSASMSYSGLDEDVARQVKVAENAPIVFLHGVGLGVLPYVGFIRKVLSVFSTDTPVIVPEIRHVSQRLVAQAQTVDQIVCEVVHVLKRHQLDGVGAHFIAHSFGYKSLVAELTASVTILDSLSCANHADFWPCKRLCCMCRNFWWHTLMLWPCELPPVSVVCLSYDDELVPCDLVQKQLKEQLQPQPEGSGRILDVILSKGPHGAFLALDGIQEHMLNSFRDGIQQAYS